MDYERFCHHLRYAPSQRERLLGEVRREVLADLARPPDVARLARARGMSRSHFSHAFKAATGLSPAQFVAQIRLEEVTRRLLTTRQTLDTIAAEVGYADATHLCKVFRRHYHMSPGSFRW
jgi:AraC-like DNA-binding protein